jgi:very-short-patch-repair endonuclease
MTGVELLLWSRLRRRQVGGHRFRRQVPLGPYVVDFACYARRLLIEVDGPSHDASLEQDAAREEWLKGQGFRVLRFRADEVLQGLDEVMEIVLSECSEGSPV